MIRGESLRRKSKESLKAKRVLLTKRAAIFCFQYPTFNAQSSSRLKHLAPLTQTSSPFPTSLPLLNPGPGCLAPNAQLFQRKHPHSLGFKHAFPLALKVGFFPKSNAQLSRFEQPILPQPEKHGFQYS
ncbi:hypothetical protein [Bartonella quintana]|uniref:Uncharacterized protein n=1 Tax=Bartonella quintana JK 68 TaxID=1134503 RepID=A0ABR4SPX2_BARQI|nr:hypothetical protein [Bartonella quintana]KEC64811.1 hypothetical protein O7U_01203 [Bartonella quintana JK 68]KEC66602.1 hypothetical protein O7S_00862 [Bartonella quintana JK 67]KEC69121.1 hypothetical protein O7Q_00111 [Bartonella quintana JK 39]